MRGWRGGKSSPENTNKTERILSDPPGYPHRLTLSLFEKMGLTRPNGVPDQLNGNLGFIAVLYT